MKDKQRQDALEFFADLTKEALAPTPAMREGLWASMKGLGSRLSQRSDISKQIKGLRDLESRAALAGEVNVTKVQKFDSAIAVARKRLYDSQKTKTWYGKKIDTDPAKVNFRQQELANLENAKTNYMANTRGELGARVQREVKPVLPGLEQQRAVVGAQARRGMVLPAAGIGTMGAIGAYKGLQPLKPEPYTPPKLAHVLDKLAYGAKLVIEERKTKTAGPPPAAPVGP